MKNVHKLKRIVQRMNDNAIRYPEGFAKDINFINKIIVDDEFIEVLDALDCKQYYKINFLKFIFNNIDAQSINTMITKTDGYSDTILHRVEEDLTIRDLSCEYLYWLLKLIIEFCETHKSSTINRLIRYKNNNNETFMDNLVDDCMDIREFNLWIFDIFDILIPEYVDLIKENYSNILDAHKLESDGSCSSLMWLAVNNYYHMINRSLLTKLWDLNLDLNIQNEKGFTFLHCAVNHEVNYDSFFNLLKESINHGFDVNQKPTIMKTIIENNYGIDSFKKEILNYLCDNGYDLYSSDINDPNLLRIVYKEETLIDEFIQNYIIGGLKHKLKNYNIELEKDFDFKFKKIYYDFNVIVNNIRVFFAIEDGDTLINVLVKAIVDYHNSNVNNYNTITVTDILESLKLIISNEQDRFFKQVDDCKIKYLNPKNI